MNLISHGTFVSEKINKIRWRPDFMNDSHYFITGSWDNEQNSVKLWDFQVNEEDSEIDPFLIAEYPFQGDVTEAKFLNGDLFVTSSSLGSAHLMRISTDHGIEPVLECRNQWENIHSFPTGDPSPCTSFALYDNDIVTVGEDGGINLLNSEYNKVIRKISNADSCSMQCVIFLKHNEIITSNLIGQLKCFDIRIGNNEPTNTFTLSEDPITAMSLEHHPTQRHLVVAGDEEGSLTVWDLRQHAHPISLLKAHEGGVSEIHFHPDHPDQLFTSSTAGDVWHWLPKSEMSVLNSTENVWLSSGALNNKLDVVTLMSNLHKPINSLDINRGKVICGCDNEAIYLITGVSVLI